MELIDETFTDQSDKVSMGEFTKVYIWKLSVTISKYGLQNSVRKLGNTNM